MRRGNKINTNYITKPIAVLTAISLSLAAISGCSDQPPAANANSENVVPEDKKLILYTSHKEEVYGPIVKEFEERTGIWVQVRAGGTTELMDDIRKENGKNSCDVMFGGGVETYDANKEFFQPYRCSQSQMLSGNFISPDDSWTVFTELPIVFIYNNKLVDTSSAPSSWEELLTDRWKGKIAFAAPGKSGTSYTALATMIQVLDMDEDTAMKKFAEALDGNVSAGSGEVVDEVSSGIRLVGVTLEEAAKKRIVQGADISMAYPKEGTSAVPDGCALVKGARHVENAKLFIDFTVSDDVQQLAMDQFQRRTVRRDLIQEEEENDIKIMDYDLEWASSHQEHILKMWSELME